MPPAQPVPHTGVPLATFQYIWLLALTVLLITYQPIQHLTWGCLRLLTNMPSLHIIVPLIT